MAKEFPDLTGDGKVTKADILKGRGVPGAKKGGLTKKLGVSAMKLGNMGKRSPKNFKKLK
jgi:hypothetical protein